MPQPGGFPPQVALPFAGTAHGVHEAVVAVVPHDSRLVFCAHTLPQRW